MTIDQNDDEAFVDFQGSIGITTSYNIKSIEVNTFYAMVMIEINGSKRWIKAYQFL